VIPAPRSSWLGAFHEHIRYERGAWPLWRLDRNVRYLVKSFVHRRTPWTEEDRQHLAAARAYMDAGTWRSRGARRLRLSVAGDLMWIRDNWRDAIAPSLRARIASADLAIANLETPIVPERRVPRLVYETLHYNASPELLDPWRAPPHAIISLCNNHALDQGEDGLRRTREVVTGFGLAAVGGADVADAIAARHVAGVRVAAIGTTYGINHATTAPAGIPVVRFGDPEHEPDWTAIAALIARARAAGPDLVISCAHWGFEYEHWPAATQRAHAIKLVELGVDVIAGSSPHVLQPIELVSIDGRDAACPMQARRGGRPRFGVIAWSLGNFTTIMPTLACHVGALVELVLDDALDPIAIRAIPTLSRRGLGASVIGGATLPVSEHAGHEAELARRHATAILGTISEGDL
jgi:poly-gamma-glutamate synthesis protein (capsule biosynthesis protein)